MSEEQAEQVESTTNAVTGGDEGAETAQDSQPDLAAEVAALRERLDAQSEANSESEEVDLIDYLTVGEESDEGEEQQYEPADPADENEQLIAQLDAYIDEAVQERIQPTIESIQTQERNRQLLALADKYPDLRDHLEPIGQRLGRIAESRGDQSLRSDPQMVELAYMAVKAAATAGAETPVSEGSVAKVESSSISQPDSGPSEDELLMQRVLGTTRNPGDEAILG